MESLKGLGYCAVELYFSAVCNLNCIYCFQPKVAPQMECENKKIIEWLKSDQVIEDLKDIFEDDLESIAFWGGEPSINLPYFNVEKAVLTFPKLKGFSFSTNISTTKLTDNIINFIKEVDKVNQKYKKNIKIDVQFSIDGLPEINDKNRVGSSGEEILKNIDRVVKETNKIPNRKFCIKGTWSSDNFKWLADINNLRKLYRFYEKKYLEWKTLGDVFPMGGEYITIAYPGKYTKEDGLLFKKITENLLVLKREGWKLKMNFDTQLSTRLKDAYTNLKRAAYRPYKGELLCKTSCSAGRSCLGVAPNKVIHLCHSTFFFDENLMRYIRENNLITEFEKTQGYSFKNFENFIKNKAYFKLDDEEENLMKYRILSQVKNYSCSIPSKIQYEQIIINEYRASNLIEVDDKLAEIAVAFSCFGGMKCLLNNMWENGNLWVENLSYIKLLFNGAADLILKDFVEKENYLIR